jgi:cell division protein FtsX
LVEELSSKVEQLQTQLNEQIDVSIELVKELNESKKIEVFHSMTEGLTQTQIEKLKSLVESVEFTTEEEFAEKLETIKENYFPSDVKRGNESSLHESVEDPELTNQVKISDPRMAAYAQVISRTLAK